MQSTLSSLTLGLSLALLADVINASEKYSFKEISIGKDIGSILQQREDIKLEWKTYAKGPKRFEKLYKKALEDFSTDYKALGLSEESETFKKFFFYRYPDLTSKFGCVETCDGDVREITMQVTPENKVDSFRVVRMIENVDVNDLAEKVVKKYGQPFQVSGRRKEHEPISMYRRGFSALYNEGDNGVTFSIDLSHEEGLVYRLSYEAYKNSYQNADGMFRDEYRNLRDELSRKLTGTMPKTDVDI